jgi:oligogalacturonide lyase
MRFRDPISDVPMVQVTNWRTHSHHLYFTENGWYDNNERLLFISDRENQPNLYSVHLKTGEITQLTDLNSGTDDLSTCLNPSGTKAYFRNGKQVIELDLSSLQETLLYVEEPQGPMQFNIGQLTCSANGKHVISSLSENLSHRFRIDLGNGYIGHREIMEAKPLCKIVEIPITGGKPQTVFEEENWIGHINASLTDPELLTFCHEGPWQLVDHRIWGLRIGQEKPWKIRPRKTPHEI